MIFGNDRQQLRKAYADAWHKFQHMQPMQPLERQIAEVVKEHPEYHNLLQNIETDFLPEMGQTNPFLHMGMHLALREQIATDRPAGIVECYQALLQKHSATHEAEHDMMDCLGEALWQAQRQGTQPDESAYLACLRSRAGIGR
jgi:hypothetical protein